MATFTETFNKADGALGPDLAWTLLDLSGSPEGVEVASMEAVSAEGIGGAMTDDFYDVDQTVSVTLSTWVIVNNAISLFARISDVTLSTSFYEADVYKSGANFHYSLINWSGSVNIDVTGTAPVSGDVVTLSCVGSAIEVQLNGVAQISTTDVTQLVGGHAGFGIFEFPAVVTLDQFVVESTLTPDHFPVGPYPYGRQAHGAGRYGGDHPFVIVPSTVDRQIPFLVANDRYQTVLATDIGTSLRPPKFRYWNAQPHLWPEMLGDPTISPPLYAVNEHDKPVTGRVELHVDKLVYGYRRRQGELYDAQVDGIVVEFIPRPTAIGTLDGGLPPSTPIAITGTVECYGLEGVQREDSFGRVSGVVEAHSINLDQSTLVTEQSSDLWPNVRTAWFPVRSDLRARSIRVVLYFTLAEFVGAYLLGTLAPARTT